MPDPLDDNDIARSAVDAAKRAAKLARELLEENKELRDMIEKLKELSVMERRAAVLSITEGVSLN